MGHGRPGPAAQTEKREWFARLIAQGISNAKACRIVGVNPRTGKRWRHGRTITSSSGRRLRYPAVIGARAWEISPRYLSEDERVRIADLRRQGLGVRAVAAELGRSPATVSRELRRNRDLGSGQYRPFAAQRLAAARRARPGRGKLVRDPVLRHFVAVRLEKRWSPEQISRALRGEFPDEPERRLVHETIYQAVYRPELGGLRRDLPRCCVPADGAADRPAPRCDHRCRQPLGDRHPGRPREPVHHLAAPARPAAYRRGGLRCAGP
jgi:transposase, IS30 family